jgi:hypothetical protein
MSTTKIIDTNISMLEEDMLYKCDLKDIIEDISNDLTDSMMDVIRLELADIKHEKDSINT